MWNYGGVSVSIMMQLLGRVGTQKTRIRALAPGGCAQEIDRRARTILLVGGKLSSVRQQSLLMELVLREHGVDAGLRVELNKILNHVELIFQFFVLALLPVLSAVIHEISVGGIDLLLLFAELVDPNVASDFSFFLEAVTPSVHLVSGAEVVASLFFGARHCEGFTLRGTYYLSTNGFTR